MRGWVVAMVMAGFGALGVRAAPPAPPPEPVRGVWVAAPHHNAFWGGRAAMRRELQQLAALGFNTVYAVALLPGRTLHPSARMAAAMRMAPPQADARDPFAELLAEAKPLGLRVIAWLEFGFASHYGPDGGPGLLQVHPEWAALGSDGRAVVKNGFHWMNALDPAVQDLLIGLSVELLRRYPTLDGVQGDDRLPAMPAEAGYQPAVLAAYGWRPGQALPAPQDPAWRQWRADQLTAFLRRWRAAVKAERPQAVLSLAPSPFPWGLEEYLQDWPTWLREGLADELLPQLYRRDGPAYERLLRETVQALPPGTQARVFPGMLLALGGELIPSPRLLQDWLAANRAAGFAGEVQFHSVGVAARAEVFRAAYRAPPASE